MAILLLLAAQAQDLGEVLVPASDLRPDGTGTGEYRAREGLTVSLVFAEEELRDAGTLHLLRDGESVPFLYEVTSRWPNEWVRTMVLLVDLRAGTREETLRLERRRSRNRDAREARPGELEEADIGSGVIRLPASLASLGLFGPLAPGDEMSVRLYESARGGRAWMDEPTDERNPYEMWWRDPIRALYQMYLVSGDPDLLRDAHRLALRYRTEQVILDDLTGSHLRMTGGVLGSTSPQNHIGSYCVQGLLDDYLLTGDGGSLQAARRLGEDLLGVYPQYLYDGIGDGGFTRGWCLVQFVALHEATRERSWLDASRAIVGHALQTQDQSGAWLMDYSANPAPVHCAHARGGDTQKIAPLLEGLIAYARITGDRRTRDAVVRAAEWVLRARTADGNRLMCIPDCPECGPETAFTTNTLGALPALAFAARETGREDFRAAASDLLDRTLPYAPDRGRYFAESYRWSAQAIGYLRAEER